MTKPLAWAGSSKRDLSAFPDDAKSEAGYQLFLVQEGLDPTDWRSMSTVGPGVREIRIDTEDGWYRVIYVASFASAVYVLHAFQKTTKKTAQSDIRLAQQRYKEVRAHEQKSKH